MARGDAVNDIVSSTNSSTIDIGPTGTVEWVIKFWGGDLQGNMYLRADDGSNQSNLAYGNTDTSVNGSNCTIPITATNHLDVWNNVGSTKTFPYFGYITKE